MVKHFKVTAKDGTARAGVLKTAHGDVHTPTFMPVGTQASVKALAFDDLKTAKAQIILGNTYHLYLRPGSKLIKKMGGLHKFMNWQGPILTDSGGFQAFSLGAMIAHDVSKVPGKTVYLEKEKKVIKRTKLLSRITDEGVQFTSHLDGSKHLLTPEKSIEVQLDLGSDIVLVLDELLSPMHTKGYVKKSLERTHNWEIRSKKYFDRHLEKSANPNALLFGIVQGVYDQKIREGEAKWVAEQEFDGISVGGSFGTSKYWRGADLDATDLDWAATKAIYTTLEWVIPNLPEELPKHILGIGEVQDFFECVERGADMFDCVAPTRRARNGSLYLQPKNGGNVKNKFTLSIQRAEFTDDHKPIDPGCNCFTCQNFSRAYLRHLYLAGEILFHRLTTVHNVYFMNNLIEQIRASIADKKFKSLKKQWLMSDPSTRSASSG